MDRCCFPYSNKQPFGCYAIRKASFRMLFIIVVCVVVGAVVEIVLVMYWGRGDGEWGHCDGGLKSIPHGADGVRILESVFKNISASWRWGWGTLYFPPKLLLLYSRLKKCLSVSGTPPPPPPEFFRPSPLPSPSRFPITPTFFD